MVRDDDATPIATERRCAHCDGAHPATYTHCPNTGRPIASGLALVGQVIDGRYRVTGLLGEGGMGAVYAAEHLQIGRKVAVKRLLPELAADPSSVLRFQREARAAAATGHEHIVQVIDLGVAEDGAPYLVMELLQGQSLAALLRKVGRLSAARACRIVGEALTALDAVHRRDIVHRDLKPDNIFLTRLGGRADYVKLLDFGISKMRGQDGEPLDLTRTGVTVGTPYYMSPEQARGTKTLDRRVDLYATGVILYECLVGRVPFQGENYHQLLHAILGETPPSVRAAAPLVDPRLESLVRRALEKDPDARFPDAASFLEALVPFGARPLPPSDPESAALDATMPGPVVAAPTPRAESGVEGRREAHAPSAPPDPPLAPRLTPPIRPGTATPSAWALPERRAVPAPRVARRSGPPEVKGSLVSAALATLADLLGEEGLAAARSRLPSELGRRLGGAILPMSWLPLDALEALLAEVDPDASSELGLAARTGRGIAERELPVTHRLFLQTATTGTALERFPEFFRAYHTAGEVRVDTIEGLSAQVAIDVGRPESPAYAWMLAGFFQGALERTSARDVHAALDECRGRGGARTRILLRWG